MKTLKKGDRGALVALLQLALARSGYDPGQPDGVFGPATELALERFQRERSLTADGIAGPATHRALMPWYTGYVTHKLVRGESLYGLAIGYGTTLQAIETANPGLDPLSLRPGQSVVVPLSFPVVPVHISWSSALTAFCVRGLAARYPFAAVSEAGRSVLGRPLYCLTVGQGSNRVLYNASHHANEWLTTPVLLHFLEELLSAWSGDRLIYGISARQLLAQATLWLVPMVDPDGVDLVTGALDSGPRYEAARAMAAAYPELPFPSGWKANIRGVDLNLQYPAGWQQAREIKFAQGFDRPGPRDYVGEAPLSAPESRAMYELTWRVDPALTLSYHSQGRVIYWKYQDMEPPGARAIGARFGRISGYQVEDTPYASGFAGYKDWFVQDYDRPGYTVEIGQGVNPLPLSQFGEIYRDNLGILTEGLYLTGAGVL